MSRPVAIRVNYREDAGYLLRLEAAIEIDVTQSDGWRKETMVIVRQLVKRLLEADKGRNKKLDVLKSAR
jgi:hypothetical protein